MAEKTIQISKDKMPKILEMWSSVEAIQSEALDMVRALDRKKHLMDIAKIDFWGGVKELYPEIDSNESWRFEKTTQEFVLNDKESGPSELLKMLKSMGQGPRL